MAWMIKEGDEVVVIVLFNRKSVGEITHDAVSDDELLTQVYTDDEASLILLSEAIAATAEAVRFHMAKPHLKRLVDRQIAKMRAEDDDREAGQPPSPIVH